MFPVSAVSVADTAKTTVFAKVLPETAGNKKLIWTSGDKSVFTVDSNGVVTGVAAGTADRKRRGFSCVKRKCAGL